MIIQIQNKCTAFYGYKKLYFDQHLFNNGKWHKIDDQEQLTVTMIFAEKYHCCEIPIKFKADIFQVYFTGN